MKKFILVLIFLFQLPIANSFQLITQSDSVFDDSDLADIEGLDGREEDTELEEEFGGDFTDEGSDEDNFDVGDFEMVEPESQEDSAETENIKPEMPTDDFNKNDYEVLSDKPGYEVITDEELEQEFSEIENEVPSEEEAEESPEDNREKEGMELVEEPEGMELIEGSEDTESVEEPESVESLDEFVDIDSVQESEDEDTNQLKKDIEAIQSEEEELNFLEEELEGTTEEEEELKREEEQSQTDEGLDESEDESLDLDQPEVFEEPSIEGLPVEEESFDTSSLNLITNIRYLTEKDQVIIDTSEIASYQERSNLETNQLIIEVLQSQLGENLHWPYVLRDFNTNFGLVKADQKDSSTVRVVIQLKEGAEFPKTTLSKEGNQILIGFGEVIDNEIVSGDQESSVESDLGSILPAKTLEDLYFGNIEFSGAPLSFHVIDAPIKQVLRFISEESGLNMVIDESVAGTVTLKLEDVPWDQALHTIFKVKSLGYTRDGNVITILPLSKIEERTKKLKEISDRQKSLSPFKTKVIPIMYAKATEVEKQVKSFSTPAGQGLAKGGRIIVHDESNTLVVVDTDAVIKKILAMTKFLDKAPQQVMIEAKIVEVKKSFAKNFGFNWSLGGDFPVRIDASGIVDFFYSTLSGIGGSYSSSYSGKDTINTFTVNGLPFIGNVNATLSLAENEESAQVLSTVKIVTKSGQSASVTKNTPILIYTGRNTALDAGATGGATEGGAEGGVAGIVQETAQTEDVELSLKVTPIVTSSGSIAVQADINLSTPGSGVTGTPVKTARKAQTEVLTKSGQTVVLSGIYEKNETHDKGSVPWLGKVPFIGWMFKNKSSNFAESEMLMFITPTLVDQ